MERIRKPIWVTALMVVCLILISTAGIWFYISQKAALFQRAERDLEAIARLKSNQITAWRAELIAGAEVILQGEILSGSALRVLAERDSSSGQLLLSYFDGLQEAQGYSRVILVDSVGCAVLATPGVPADIHEPGRIALREALSSGRPVLTDLHLGVSDDALHFSVVLPLPGLRAAGSIRGGIVLQVDPREFLFPLVESWPVPSRTAETLIVRTEGDSVLFLNNLRHLEGAEFSLKIPLTSTDVPAVQAVLGRTGIMRGTDYRGVEVLSAILPIEGSPSFIVSKIDVDEILDGWKLVAALIHTMILITILASLASITLLWQRSAKLQYRKLLETEKALRSSEQHREHLMSCLMAIRNVNQLITQIDDPQELIDGACQELTRNLSFSGAWISLIAREGEPALLASSAAAGIPFNPFPSDARDPLPDCVKATSASKGVVSVSRNTCPHRGCPVKARSDSCRIIAHSLGNAGENFGIILVTLPDEYSADTEVLDLFAEVAGDLSFAIGKLHDAAKHHLAEKALAESEEKYRRLFENAPVGVFQTASDGRVLQVNPELARMLGCGNSMDAKQSYADLRTSLYADPARRDLFLRLLEESGEVRDFEYEAVLADGSRRWLSMNARLQERSDDGVFLIDGFTRDITGSRLAGEERARLENQLRQAQKMEAVGRLAGGVAHDFNNMLQTILGYSEMALQDLDASSHMAEMLTEIQKAARRSADLTGQLLAFARKQTISPHIVDLNEVIGGMLNLLGRLIGENIELTWEPGDDVRPVLIDTAQLGQVLTNLTINARDSISGSGKLTIETGTAELDDAYCENHPGALPGSYSVLSVSDDGAGMDRATMAMIFEPFFTTKPQGMGTGLGLSTVYGIVKQNGGFINVYSEPENGSTFRIYLPWSKRGAPWETRFI